VQIRQPTTAAAMISPEDPSVADPTGTNRALGVDYSAAYDLQEPEATQTLQNTSREPIGKPSSPNDLAALFGFTADDLKDAVYAPDVTARTTGKRSIPPALAENADEKRVRKVYVSPEKVFQPRATAQEDRGPTRVQSFPDNEPSARSVPGNCHNCGQTGHWASDCKLVLAKMTAGRESKCALCVHSCAKGDTIAKLGAGPFMYSWVHLACAKEHLTTLGVL